MLDFRQTKYPGTIVYYIYMLRNIFRGNGGKLEQ